MDTHHASEKAQVHLPSLCRPKQKVIFAKGNIYNIWPKNDRLDSCIAFSQSFYRLMPWFSVIWFAFLEFNDIRILNPLFKVSCKQDIISVNRQPHRFQR